jgi:hypothetical protein
MCEHTGAIDCGSHFRCRVHPRQADWYRYDKAGFFITAQVIVDLSGRILRVDLGMGHNNDQGMFNMTEIANILEEHNIKILADGGYSHYLLVKPDDDKPAAWNNKQKSLRSCVETVIGMSKHWEFANSKVRVNPELHGIGLMLIYNLVAMRMKEYPLRPHL